MIKMLYYTITTATTANLMQSSYKAARTFALETLDTRDAGCLAEDIVGKRTVAQLNCKRVDRIAMVQTKHKFSNDLKTGTTVMKTLQAELVNPHKTETCFTISKIGSPQKKQGHT